MPYRTNQSWFDVKEFPPTTRNIFFAIDYPGIRKNCDDPTLELIAIQCEPESIVRTRNTYLRDYAHFDLILTYDAEILKHCPNARMCLFGSCWIKPEIYRSIDMGRKKRQMSSIVGSKLMTVGHELRQLLYRNQVVTRSPMPITWFRSSKGAILPRIRGSPVLQGGKDELFLDYQFSLVIENSRQENYFTEKLIDCLVTKTIPIYYGCPNINTWFDTRGWIILKNEDFGDFQVAIMKLEKIDYSAHINVINENYERALQFVDHYRHVRRAMNLGDGTDGAPLNNIVDSVPGCS